MKKLIVQFLIDETGATSIEYAIIASGVVIVGAVQGLGSAVKGSYVAVQTAMK